MIFERDKPRLLEEFDETYRDSNDAIRWISSNNAVPNDIMGFWFEEGLVSSRELMSTNMARDVATEHALTAYIKQRKAMTHDQRAEEAYELRAAFGPGEHVVNVLTGETYNT